MIWDIRHLLTDDQLRNFDDSVSAELSQKIKKNNIQDICCYHIKSFKAESLALIATVFAESPTIRTVDMRYNHMGSDGPTIASILAKSPTIHTVDMGENDLRAHGPETAANLAKASNLHTVDMSYNKLEENCPAVAESLANSPTVRVVHISGNMNSGKYGLAVATAFAKDPNLHTVDMSNNSLEKHGPAVVEILAESPTIHTINISHNCLIEFGSAVATALSKHPYIRFVDLRKNTPYGSTADEILEFNSTIQGILNTHNNDLKILQDALKSPDAMEKLECPLPCPLMGITAEYLGQPIEYAL